MSATSASHEVRLAVQEFRLRPFNTEGMNRGLCGLPLHEAKKRPFKFCGSTGLKLNYAQALAMATFVSKLFSEKRRLREVVGVLCLQAAWPLW